jgi:hypothetical protein
MNPELVEQWGERFRDVEVIDVPAVLVYNVGPVALQPIVAGWSPAARADEPIIIDQNVQPRFVVEILPAETENHADDEDQNSS